MMPENLILIRHGQSEGNIANKLSKKGDDKYFTEEFMDRHSSTWRLTDLGIKQAKMAGSWIRENIDFHIDDFHVSDYARAQETIKHVIDENPKYSSVELKVNFYLNERDWGNMDVMPYEQRLETFSKSIEKRARQPFYWTPPNGESLLSLSLRLDSFLGTLHREAFDKNVMVVCHGEVMWCLRTRLERISQTKFMELDASKSPYDKIHNCQILHYTRRNPVTGTLSKYLSHMRSMCPTDLNRSRNDWIEIVRKKYTSEELMQEVSLVERMAN